MGDQPLERSVLEGKERDQLHAIAAHLGMKPAVRTKKADLVSMILQATGVEEPGEAPAPKPRRTRTRKAAEPQVDNQLALESNGNGGSPAATTSPEQAQTKPVAAETAPVESTPVESAPVESAPVESAPVESAPANGTAASDSPAAETPPNASEPGAAPVDTGSTTNHNGGRPRRAKASMSDADIDAAVAAALAEISGDAPPPASETRGNGSGARRPSDRTTTTDETEDAGEQASGGSFGAPAFRRTPRRDGGPEAADQQRNRATAGASTDKPQERTERSERADNPRNQAEGSSDNPSGSQAGGKADNPSGGRNDGGARGDNRDGRQNNQNQGGRQNQGGQGGQNQGGQGGQNQGGQAGNRAEAEGGRRSRRRRGRDRERLGANYDKQVEQAAEQYQGEPIPVSGVFDLRPEGFGFIRPGSWVGGPDDTYVPVNLVKKHALRAGDLVAGNSRPATPQEKFPALLEVGAVNGMDPEKAKSRPKFENLTPLFPDEKLKLELGVPGDPANVTGRIIDMISPIGKGQRGLIVSPPKAGKTTVMKHIAKCIETNHPDVELMVLLVDERPEEVTDMRRSVKGQVIGSTFDRPADEHTKVSELAIEVAKRRVELGRDVVIILDGITRLARAYNLAAPATGRIMSGGIDTGALYPPKKFLGAARNCEEGGSLTILATALVETGNTMDSVIFEEFKGTGNMELRLDRRVAEKRVYPAIDVTASSTRHEELLFDRAELRFVWQLRRALIALQADSGNSSKGLEMLLEKIKQTKSNHDFLDEMARTPQPQPS